MIDKGNDPLKSGFAKEEGTKAKPKKSKKEDASGDLAAEDAVTTADRWTESLRSSSSLSQVGAVFLSISAPAITCHQAKPVVKQSLLRNYTKLTVDIMHPLYKLDSATYCAAEHIHA